MPDNPLPAGNDQPGALPYPALYEALPEPALMLTVAGEIRLLNSACARFLNRPADALLHTPLTRYCEDAAPLQETLQKAAAGSAADAVMLSFSVGGATRRGELRLSPLYTGNAVTAFSATLREASGESITNQHLSEIKELYEAVLHSIVGDVAVFDNEGRYAFLNTHAIKDNYWREWIVGHTDYEYAIARQRDPALALRRMKAYAEVLQTKQPQEYVEVLTDASGRPRYHLRRLEALQNGGKDFVIGSGLDITNLKETEKDLVEKESYLRSVLHSLPDNILRVDKAGRFVSVVANNDRDMTFPLKDIIGRTLHDLLPPAEADSYLADIRQVLHSGEPLRKEHQRPNLEGVLNYYEDRIARKSDTEVVVIIRNITDQKAFESRIRATAIQSEEKERNRIATELHDGVCQELTAAKLTIELAEATAVTEDATFGQLLQKSKTIIQNALNSIRRASHQLMSNKLADLGFTGMLQSLVEELNGVDRIRYELKVEGAPLEPPKETATHLVRIVQEFIRNSQQHSSTERLLIRLHFFNDELTLSLQDFGKGFTLAPENKSSGIGVVNMLNRVSAIGGSYTLDTAPGKGVVLAVKVQVGATE